jgi:hypothetical protein
MGPGGGHGPPSTLKKNLIINVKKKKVFCLLAPCKKKKFGPLQKKKIWPLDPLSFIIFSTGFISFETIVLLSKLFPLIFHE